MRVLVTGGTGSFGHAYVKRHYGTQQITVFSRDEEKQRAMQAEFPDVEYVLGDIRDRETVHRIWTRYWPMRVFHAAALKQVPSTEFWPMEAVRTNVEGTDNVFAEGHRIDARTILLSTDKAVEPAGVMGATKMLAESIASHWGQNSVRYGNVIGSRGSIVPVFREMVERGEPITITDPEMTRFLITLDEALDLLEMAMEAEPSGTIYVKRSSAATVAQLARVIAPGHPTVKIGVRPGEKRVEHLVVPDEPAEVFDDHFRIKGRGPGTGIRYSSDTAPRLTDAELYFLIHRKPYVPDWVEAFG